MEAQRKREPMVSLPWLEMAARPRSHASSPRPVHSRASHAKVVVEGHGYPGTLTVMISDDGIGGARADSPGLAGLADRVSGVDGRLSVESPPGGPTIIAAELPCG